MGGHGGLNILPQKRWNVYNYDNREKVRRDEEAAAKEEQLKREQSRKRDSEFRLNQLRAARGMPKDAEPKAEMESASSSSGHINLFEGIRMFDPKDEGDEPKKKKQKKKDDVSDGSRSAAKSVSAEDEKYRLGYGVAGKGVKVPWYLEKKTQTETETKPPLTTMKTKPPTKTVEELREERLRREHREKQRERALIRQTRR